MNFFRILWVFVPVCRPERILIVSEIWPLFSVILEAQKLVEDMEKERRKLDKQLDLVQEKTKRAYLSQEILEAKMKVPK